MKKIQFLLCFLLAVPTMVLAVDLPTADQVLNSNQQDWDIQSLIMLVGLIAVGIIIAILAVYGLYTTITGALSKLDDVKFGKASMSEVVVFGFAGLAILGLTVVLGLWVYGLWGG